MDKRIPVTLLTGFLGSGKTTLLARLLNHAQMKDTAVVINELGKAGLDHILAQSLNRKVESQYIAESMVLLESGCMCCTLANEMADTLRDLFFRRSLGAIPEFQRLVIETTGMADPGPIMANLLNEQVINSAYRLDAVVVTVDATHGLQQLEQHIEARKQAAVADVLLVTKIDLASRQQLDVLMHKLADLNPGASLHCITQGRIDPRDIINVGLFDASSKKAQPQRWLREIRNPVGRIGTARGTLPQKAHADGISSFTVTMPKPLTWEQLEPVLQWLCATFGENLLRLKGIVHAENQPAPLAVHAVQRTLYPPTLLIDWDEDEPITRLVLIGQDLDEEKIRAALTQA